MLVCVRCGHQNEERQKYCQSCNAVLPRISESISAPPPERINIHYDLLRKAGEEVLAQKITPEQFMEILDQISVKISEGLAEIESLEITEEIRKAMQEQLDLGFSGMHYFLQGIEEMRIYVQDSDPSHISQGMEFIYQGNENLNAALDIARNRIRRLREFGLEAEINTGDISSPEGFTG